MINITKSLAPNRVFSYKESVIRDAVQKDFHKMCYLCEEVTRHYEIDHFYPQKDYEYLIDDWNNLFYICQKCNKIRPKNINTCSDNEVLNNCEDNVESLLIIYYNSTDESIIILPNTIDSKILYKVENTIRLLNRIYNGIDTTSLSYIDLRNEIEEKVAQFEKDIENYRKAIGKFKELFKKPIIRALSKKSQKNESSFVSFKRYIIKSKASLKEFEQYFD